MVALLKRKSAFRVKLINHDYLDIFGEIQAHPLKKIRLFYYYGRSFSPKDMQIIRVTMEKKMIKSEI
jgi:hypothetical protein